MNGKNEEQIMNAKRVQMGPKNHKEAPCVPNTQFCDVFKVSLEAHETKEKETNEQGSDASPTKSNHNDSASCRLGSERWFWLIQNYAPHRGQEAKFRNIMILLMKKSWLI